MRARSRNRCRSGDMVKGRKGERSILFFSVLVQITTIFFSIIKNMGIFSNGDDINSSSHIGITKDYGGEEEKRRE